MSCASSIQTFLNQTFSYIYNGITYVLPTPQFATWVSYRSYISPFFGDIPISLIIAHWGNESGWGGPDISTYYNPANQGSTCGWSACGHEPNGLPAFCNIRDGVQSYSALIIQGYPYVAHAYVDGGSGSDGMKAAAIALGQGYEAGVTLSQSFCGGPAAISSSSPRLWATSKYNNGHGPGSSLYDTVNANTCLSSYNYVQTTNPQLPGF